MKFSFPKNVTVDVTAAEFDSDKLETSFFKTVLKARESYLQYGDVSLVDPYDVKSTIFLAEAQFSRPVVSEYITMRMFPLLCENDDSAGSEEADFFVYRENGEEKNVYKLLKEKNIPLSEVGSISRLGSIKAPNHLKNECMAHSFAAIQLQMCERAKELGIKWIISQLHTALVNQSLSYNGKTLNFTPLLETFSLKGSLFLDRENEFVWEYMLKYPGYFLDVAQLNKALAAHWGEDYTPLKWADIKTIVPRILADQKLQKYIKIHVADAVYLSLVSVDDWIKTNTDLLNTIQNDK